MLRGRKGSFWLGTYQERSYKGGGMSFMSLGVWSLGHQVPGRKRSTHVCLMQPCQENLRGKLSRKIKNSKHNLIVFGNYCFCGVLTNWQEETEFPARLPAVLLCTRCGVRINLYETLGGITSKSAAEQASSALHQPHPHPPLLPPSLQRRSLWGCFSTFKGGRLESTAWR